MENKNIIENEEEDEFAKQLEADLEQSSNIYVNKLELTNDKSDDDLLLMTKEEIITYKNIQISQLKSYINSLEKEKEDLISNFKTTTDALIEKIKQIEYNSIGIRPQTSYIVKEMNQNFENTQKNSKIQPKNDEYSENDNIVINFENKVQRCPNCTKEFEMSEFIEHSLQCLRKIYRCNKCNKTMNLNEKETHYNNYQNKSKMINAIQTNDESYFKEAIKHGFNINNNVLEENSGNHLIEILAINNKINLFKLLFNCCDDYEKINVNIRNKSDLTPLMICCKNNFIDFCREIIKRGGDVNAKNILGDTPLRIAQMNNNEKLSLMLINEYKAIFK